MWKLLNGSQGNTHHNGGGDDGLGKNHGRGGIEDFKKTERTIPPQKDSYKKDVRYGQKAFVQKEKIVPLDINKATQEDLIKIFSFYS